MVMVWLSMVALSVMGPIVSRMIKPEFSSTYEDDYLIRSVGTIAKQSDFALTELLANAWDAGASEVYITIPDCEGEEIIIVDNGHGMTLEQFRERWMKLRYNRLKHQGDYAEPCQGSSGQRRFAYGRNGIGRHGMLCFASSYIVESYAENKGYKFQVETSRDISPLILKQSDEISFEQDGTTLRATVVRNLPNADNIREILATRFVHEPSFHIFVNGVEIPVSENPNVVDTIEEETSDGVRYKIQLLDSARSARTKLNQGIAFWVGGRLVGRPGWTVGEESLVDARTKFGKRFTFIVNTFDLFDEVLPDWTAFKKSPKVDSLREAVSEYVLKKRLSVSSDQIKETKKEALEPSIDRIRRLHPSAMDEVGNFVEDMVEADPAIKAETLELAVRTLVNLQQSKSGQRLIEKLSQFSEDDIESLDLFLEEWTLEDASAVLEELDRRIAVVEAIKILSGKPDADELNTLHPLVARALWLFGPEYESSEYASNISIRNAVDRVFGERKEPEAFDNSRKRPDLLLLKDAMLSTVGIESYEDDTGLSSIREVLLIEVKRGKHPIRRPEKDQAVGYVEDIFNCGLIDGKPKIKAFVVGHEVKGLESRYTIGDYGTVYPVTYGRLIRSAEHRLFKLRERLGDRYKDVEPRSSALRDLLKHSEQLSLIDEMPAFKR